MIMSESTKFMLICMVKYMIDRFYEASTWRGLILVITGIAGATLSLDEETSLISLGLALSGAVGAFLPDRFKKK
jgi:hypothetical protein